MFISLLLALAAPALAQVNLLDDLSQWSANVDQAPAEIAIAQAGDILAAEVIADGGKENYPKLRREFAEPQNWRSCRRLHARLRVTCDDPETRHKRIAFVFYDDQTRLPNYPGNPMRQQVIAHSVPVNRWVDISEWLIAIKRETIRQLDLYIYELPPGRPHTYRWEVARLELEQVTGDVRVFDTEVYAMSDLKGAATQPAATVRTDDGLELVVGGAGEILTVKGDAQTLGSADANRPTGLLVRDVAAGGRPAMAGGKITQDGDTIHQTARLDELGLAVEATYRGRGPFIEIAGTVADLRSEDRAVTLYFALPLAQASWQWWDSVAEARTDPDDFTELAYLERGLQYGLNGVSSKYPIGAVTWPQHAGLTLGVRMDEPVVHRIAYNPGLRLFYIAFDFGLVPEPRQKGRPLSEAPFRILLYRHDPSWGFRSALQRYYDFFPEFFTNRVESQGGWYVWGNVEDTEGALEAGFRFHWGPQAIEAVRYDNENGLLAFNYIEPELFQLTMGDYDRAPAADEALTRLRKLADADSDEIATAEKLSYIRGGSGNIAAVGLRLWLEERSLSEYTQGLCRSALNSVAYDLAGGPVCSIGQYGWIGDSKWGAIFPCNLDPDIPDGRGRFDLDVTLDHCLRGWEAAGVRCDGIALDSFGGYGQLSRANFRREHFPYSDSPLSFSASDHQPVQPVSFGSVAWVRELAEKIHGQGKLLMTNCSWGRTPGWLTFAAPYLDVFGAEATRFADPEFIRAIAYRKPCTDLPYKPQAQWEVPWRLLHDIYPGHGHDLEAMKQYAGLLQELARAGWEPITGARVKPKEVRIERYGSGDRVYLSVHNTSDEEVRAEVEPDTDVLGAGQFKATLQPGDESVGLEAGRCSVGLGPRGTVVIRLGR